MKPRAMVEIYYFGCCPWSYFFAYGGGFLDKEWTKTGGDFKERKIPYLGNEKAEEIAIGSSRSHTNLRSG